MSQDASDRHLPGIKETRELDTFTNHLSRGVGSTIAAYGGFRAAYGTSVMIAGASAWPLIGVGFAASPLTYVPWTIIGRGLRELMCLSHPFSRALTLFLFNASMAFLTTWIGLAIFTSFTAMAFNPFTLPCLIGVAVAGAIVFAAAVAVASRARYIAVPSGNSACSVKGEVLQALSLRNLRPFNHHKVDDIHRTTGLYVRPFGAEESNDPRVKSLWGMFFKKGATEVAPVVGAENVHLLSGRDDVQDPSSSAVAIPVGGIGIGGYGSTSN